MMPQTVTIYRNMTSVRTMYQGPSESESAFNRRVQRTIDRLDLQYGASVHWVKR